MLGERASASVKCKCKNNKNFAPSRLCVRLNQKILCAFASLRAKSTTFAAEIEAEL